MSKKALIITNIGGFLQKFEQDDVKLIRSMGYQVHYASNFDIGIYEYDSSWLRKQNIILHQINFSKSPLDVLKNFKAFKEIKRIVDDENIDLVHCHNPIPAAIARFAAAYSKRKPVVLYTAHGFHFYKGASLFSNLIFGTVERICAGHTDILITINREDAEAAVKQLKIDKDRVYLIPGVGLDLDRYRPVDGAYSKVRKVLDIPKDTFHIVSSGEMNRNKNHRVIIEAIAELKDRNIIYSICGNDSVKGTENELRGLAEQLSVEDQVHFLGFRTDMETVLQSADLFAFPSMREGLGMAAVEALACGVPLVCGDNRGTREYAVEGYNALICGHNTVSEYVNAIRKFRTMNISADRMRENCRNSSYKFSSENTRKIMAMVYQKADGFVESRGSSK